MQISASEQVVGWLAGLPPQTKHRVRLALRAPAADEGDIKAMTADLEGFCRLRIGGLRIIYSQWPGQVIRLEYADTRDLVYETFLRILENRK